MSWRRDVQNREGSARDCCAKPWFRAKRAHRQRVDSLVAHHQGREQPEGHRQIEQADGHPRSGAVCQGGRQPVEKQSDEKEKHSQYGDHHDKPPARLPADHRRWLTACAQRQSSVQGLGVTGIDGPFAFEIGDQAEEQGQAEEKAADGVGKPVPTEVDDAIADQEGGHNQHRTQP